MMSVNLQGVVRSSVEGWHFADIAWRRRRPCRHYVDRYFFWLGGAFVHIMMVCLGQWKNSFNIIEAIRAAY